MSDLPGRTDYESDDRAGPEGDGWGSPVPAEYGSLRAVRPPSPEGRDDPAQPPLPGPADERPGRGTVSSLLRRLGEARGNGSSPLGAGSPSGDQGSGLLAPRSERSGTFPLPDDSAGADVDGRRDSDAWARRPDERAHPVPVVPPPDERSHPLAVAGAPDLIGTDAVTAAVPAIPAEPVIHDSAGRSAGPGFPGAPASARPPGFSTAASSASSDFPAAPAFAGPDEPYSDTTVPFAGSAGAVGFRAVSAPTIPGSGPAPGAEAGIDPAALAPALAGTGVALGSRRRRGGRRPTRIRSLATVRRLDMMSVVRVAFVFWLVVLIALVVASLMLWVFADASGSLPSIEKSIRTLFSLKAFKIHPASVALYTAAVGVVIAVAGMLATVVMALIYNLIADVAGGVRVELESVTSE